VHVNVLSLLYLSWNPEPEGGAVAFAFAVDTDAPAALVDDGAADGEAEAGALYEVVEP
jgi:hypothetical protein